MMQRPLLELVIGLLFLCVGYTALAYLDTLVLEPQAGRWRYREGIWPVWKQRGGPLDQLVDGLPFEPWKPLSGTSFHQRHVLGHFPWFQPCCEPLLISNRADRG